MNKLTYFTNNNGTMEITQNNPDGIVTVHTFHDSTSYNDNRDDINITPGEMVMLISLFKHIKSKDIQNDFINPYGENHG